jgi:hypothetical protein
VYRFVSEGIRIKHPNKIINNYVIENMKGVFPWGEETRHYPYISLQNLAKEPLFAVVTRNIYYHPGSKSDYPGDSIVFLNETPENPRWPSRGPALIRDCLVDSNLYFCPGDPGFCRDYLEAMHEKNADRNGLAEDPMFEGFEDKGFRLAENSPALKAGIQQIDFSKIGLIKEGTY